MLTPDRSPGASAPDRAAYARQSYARTFKPVRDVTLERYNEGTDEPRSPAIYHDTASASDLGTVESFWTWAFHQRSRRRGGGLGPGVGRCRAHLDAVDL